MSASTTPVGSTTPTTPTTPAPPATPPTDTRLLVLLMLGQIALHAAMAGQRMATPLQALQSGRSAWAVGVLLALFAALPVLMAIPAGRMVDRHGYHRPQALAVGFRAPTCWALSPQVF